MYVRELMVSYRSREDLGVPSERATVSNPRHAADIFVRALENEAVEVFALLFLTTKHALLAYHQLSRGTIDSSPAHPREIFQAALLCHAASVVLGHNHPSGDPTPSRDDCDLTKRLCEAGELIGIQVIDHIIVGDRRYFSFKEAGRL